MQESERDPCLGDGPMYSPSEGPVRNQKFVKNFTVSVFYDIWKLFSSSTDSGNAKLRKRDQ